MPSVANQIIATLKASGVKRIYAIPGDSLNGFTDAIRRDGDITRQHVRHEEAAAARARNRVWPGVAWARDSTDSAEL
jgi:pyruvate dehydrogenase (quinone)